MFSVINTFFLKPDSNRSWQIYALIPFLQTLGVALFIGLQLFCFRALSQLIQDCENDPTNFTPSLEFSAFCSQWRYFLKKGLDVFKNKRRVCIFLLGFFSLMLCLTYGSVLLSQGGIFFSWKDLFVKDPGHGPTAFLAVLTFIPVLIYATKEASPTNGSANYYAAFTRPPFWLIAHFLARVVLISAFFISSPVIYQQVGDFNGKLFLCVFSLIFIILPCINLSLGRGALLNINLKFLSFLRVPYLYYCVFYF